MDLVKDRSPVQHHQAVEEIHRQDKSESPRHRLADKVLCPFSPQSLVRHGFHCLTGDRRQVAPFARAVKKEKKKKKLQGHEKKNKKKTKRPRGEARCCVYCWRPNVKFTGNLQRKHEGEGDVSHAFSSPAGSTKKKEDDAGKESLRNEQQLATRSQGLQRRVRERLRLGNGRPRRLLRVIICPASTAMPSFQERWPLATREKHAELRKRKEEKKKVEKEKGERQKGRGVSPSDLREELDV